MGKKLGKWWRGHIQRANIHKITVFVKNTNHWFQKALVLGEINKSVHIYSTMKLPNTIKILKEIREKRQVAFKDMTITLPADFSMATSEVRLS